MTDILVQLAFLDAKMSEEIPGPEIHQMNHIHSTYGETGCDCYTRGKQHQNALRLKDEENALWKHCLVEHNGIEAEFSMKQTNVFKSCLTRQVNEAVRIEMSTADCVMNSKAEFHQAPLVRVVPVTGLLEEQEAGADPRQPAGGGGGRAGRRRTAGRN